MAARYKIPTVHVYRTEIVDRWTTEPGHYNPTWLLVHDSWLTERWWLEFWGSAVTAARTIGFEGDVINGPYVCFLPQSEYVPGWPSPFVIGWKQSNNGTTFMASHSPLPWLSASNNHAEC